jgi:ribose transport system substrate-binding protein
MKKNTISGKKLFLYLILTAIFSVAVLSVAVIYFRIYTAEVSDDSYGRTFSHYYAMITDDYKSSFWQSVYRGASEEALEDGVFLELFGSNLTYNYSSEELMEMAISAQVDGILVAGNGREEMTQLIGRASARGIPVVTMYSDNEDSARCSFVGVNGYNIGSEYGRQVIRAREDLLRLAEATGNEVWTGQNKRVTSIAVLFDDKSSAYDQNVILSGIVDAMSAQMNNSEFDIRTVAVDSTNPFSVEESVHSVFMEEQVPDIFVCLSELDTTVVYQAVVDFNMVGKVKILGYYDSDKILDAISRGVVFSTLTVNTDELGRFGVKALVEYSEYGNTSQYVTADVIIIDRSNVAEYMKKVEEDEE